MNKGKKILIVLTSLDPGGVNKMSILFAEILKEFGCHVTIAARSGFLVKELRKKNIDFIEFSKYFQTGNFITRFIAYLYALFLVFKEAKRGDFDIINNANRYTSILCLIVTKLLNIRFYSSAHGEYEGKFLLKNWSWGSKILAVSEGTKNNLIKNYHVTPYKIKVIKNSIPALKKYSEKELFEYKKLFGFNNKRIACCIANFDPVKGHYNLIKAWQRIIKKDKKVHLLLVGKYGKLKSEVIDYIKRNDLDNYITIISGNQDIPKLIGISEFTILASSREGIPTVVLESFSLGKPVIATNVHGTKEIVTNNYNGILVPPKNVNKLAEAIVKLYQDSELRERLGKDALRTYNEDFSYEKYKEKIVNFFRG